MISLSDIKRFLPLIILTCLVAAAYGRTAQNEFLGMDDHVYVWDNPHIKNGLTWDGIVWAFQADLTQPSEYADYWQPVTFISRMVDISLFGINAQWHHLGNLFFHILNVWFLYHILIRITGSSKISLWVTALWAVHPLHAEIIGWTTARKDVLSVFFGLMAIYAYFYTRSLGYFWRYAIVSLFFILSLMAKPMLITLPVLLILIDVYDDTVENGYIRIKRFFPMTLDKWPLLVLVLAYLPIPFLGQPAAFENVNPPLAKAMVAYTFYLQKIFLPIKLSLYGPMPELKISNGHLLLSLIIFSGVSFLIWLGRKKSWLLVLGWTWFILTTLPIIALTWTADRFVYFPMIGILLIFVVAITLLIKKSDYYASIFTIFVILFTLQSFKQIAVWKNDETIMLKALEYSNENYSAHNILGVFYARHGDQDKALRHLKEAVRIKPDRDKPYNNIGMILQEQGQLDEALIYFDKSVRYNPKDFRTINNIGIIYIRKGQYQKGIQYLYKALEVNPMALDVYNNIAIAYYESGNIKQAQAIAQKQNNAIIYNQFGLFAARDKDYLQALSYFEKALSINPNLTQTRDYVRQINTMLKR